MNKSKNKNKSAICIFYGDDDGNDKYCIIQNTEMEKNNICESFTKIVKVHDNDLSIDYMNDVLNSFNNKNWIYIK